MARRRKAGVAPPPLELPPPSPPLQDFLDRELDELERQLGQDVLEAWQSGGRLEDLGAPVQDAPTPQAGAGRPRLEVDVDEVRRLVGGGLSHRKVGELLGVSYRLVGKRLKEGGP